MPYLYEMHLHTAQGSACGVSPAQDYVKKYKQLGFVGIFVTDHFFNGNCRADRSLPWLEWVNQFCTGYEAAREAGNRAGLQVFFGLEERFAWDEWLVYGLDKDFLLSHPDMRTWSRGEWLTRVRAAGGCIIQAHPFRARGYMNSFDPCLGVDGVEVANSGNEPWMDTLAQRYARRWNRFMSAGSDIHAAEQRTGDKVFALSVDKPFESVSDLVRLVRENGAHTLHVPSDRLVPAVSIPDFPLPFNVYAADGSKTDWTPRDVF